MNYSVASGEIPSLTASPCHVMHSADYAVARCLSVRPSVRPSVYPSHAGILSKWLYICSNFFCLQVDTPSLFLCIKRFGYIPTGTSPNGGGECEGYENIAIFLAICRFISEIIQDRAIDTMEAELKTVHKLYNSTSFNDL